jgi:hypothetical protein
MRLYFEEYQSKLQDLTDERYYIEQTEDNSRSQSIMKRSATLIAKTKTQNSEGINAQLSEIGEDMQDGLNGSVLEEKVIDLLGDI